MPSRSEVTYFGPGPAALPTSVLEAASPALLNYKSTGVGLAEHSHRSQLANDILAETKANLKALLDVPDDYEILLMQGGGSGQFSAVVYHVVNVWVERRRQRLQRELSASDPPLGVEDLHTQLLHQLRAQVEQELRLDYIVTGSWSLKASQEAARLLGPEHVNVALDARKANDGRFVDIPGENTWQLTPTRSEGGKGAAACVYFCDNETVDGVEFPAFPARLVASANSDKADEEDERLVVADMSSNMLSRRVDVKRYAIIFVGHV